MNNFGVKCTVLQKDTRFKQHPFTPVACCDVNDRDSKFLVAGHGKLFKQTSPTTWEPAGELK